MWSYSILHRGANQISNEEKLQQTINNIEKWAQVTGFPLSETKRKGMHCCIKRKHQSEPNPK